MALYCGIDLHSRDCWPAIFGEGLKVVQEAKVGNDLDQARTGGLLRHEGPGRFRPGNGLRVIRCVGAGARIGAGETRKG